MQVIPRPPANRKEKRRAMNMFKPKYGRSRKMTRGRMMPGKKAYENYLKGLYRTFGVGKGRKAAGPDVTTILGPGNKTAKRPHKMPGIKLNGRHRR